MFFLRETGHLVSFSFLFSFLFSPTRQKLTKQASVDSRGGNMSVGQGKRGGRLLGEGGRESLLAGIRENDHTMAAGW
ncbi:hypothetical protein F4778DRAFT_720099 [Xylariomycetidae sp. FL2044]|nr:hypothetical protein F4778DRAFT_720099 [Xylariomycetidae sp. FL2044]